MEKYPCFLEMERYGLSENEAKKNVTELLNTLFIIPQKNKNNLSIKFDDKGQEREISFKELVQKTRQNGIVPYLQTHIDRNDEIFGGNFGMTIHSGFSEIKVEYAGFIKTLKSPMTDLPMEMALMQDILFYREESCLWSNEYDFDMCTRYYRAYLTTCISLVDAFINRHLLIYKYKGLNLSKVEEIQFTSRLEERLNLFLIFSTGKGLASINKGTEWLHFNALRKLRNEMTHIDSPSLGYSIKEFAEHFNYAKKGIGGLLKLIRNLQNKPTLSFIEVIRNAPIVYFNEITFKGQGNFNKVKKRQ